MADHHQMWSELQNGQGCCSCQWDRKNHLANLFTTTPRHLDRFSVRLAGLSNLAQVQAVQPVLHTIKGFGSRKVGVVGRTVPTAQSCAFSLRVCSCCSPVRAKNGSTQKAVPIQDAQPRSFRVVTHGARPALTISNGGANRQIVLPPPSVISELLSDRIPLVWDQAHATICMVHTGQSACIFNPPSSPRCVRGVAHAPCTHMG